MKALTTILFAMTLGLIFFLHQRTDQKTNENFKANQREISSLEKSLGISGYSGEYTFDSNYKTYSFGL